VTPGMYLDPHGWGPPPPPPPPPSWGWPREVLQCTAAAWWILLVVDGAHGRRVDAIGDVVCLDLVLCGLFLLRRLRE